MYFAVQSDHASNFYLRTLVAAVVGDSQQGRGCLHACDMHAMALQAPCHCIMHYIMPCFGLQFTFMHQSRQQVDCNLMWFGMYTITQL